MSLDQFKTLIGDLHRPFAIIFLTLCSGAALIIMSLRVENGNDAGVLFGAAAVLLGGMFGVRSVENWRTRRSDAEVEIAKANQSAG